MYWTLQSLKDSENKQQTLHYGSIFSAATVQAVVLLFLTLRLGQKVTAPQGTRPCGVVLLEEMALQVKNRRLQRKRFFFWFSLSLKIRIIGHSIGAHCISAVLRRICGHLRG
jgi:hypothetical protein